METSIVRKRVNDTIELARREAAERRTRTDAAARDYARLLDDIAIPLFRQVAASLKASGFTFTVFTPGGSVRLMSDRTAEDFIELTLDTTGDRPRVMGRTSHARGRRVIESERPVVDDDVANIDENDVLEYVVKELKAFVER